MRGQRLPMLHRASWAGMVIAMAWLSGCATVNPGDTGAQLRYNAAIFDAAVASPNKIRALLPIPEAATTTVVSWMGETGPCPLSTTSSSTPCIITVRPSRLWVTLSGEVQTLCKSWHLSGDALRRRLEQLLGLPPDQPLPYRKTRFVTMEVPRGQLERPCLGTDNADPARPTCTLNGPSGDPTPLGNFVGGQMAASYIVNNPGGPGYPFTRLGYTYDWHFLPGAPTHYGASEFVVTPNTQAKVIAQMTTDEYCSPGKAR